MKKFFFTAILALSVVFAQAQFNFGVKAGYNSSLTLANLSDVTNGTYDLNSVKAEMWNNFHAGIFTRIGIKKLYIEPELLYSIQKTNYQVTLQDALNNNVTLNKFVNVSTVDVPILVGLKLIDLKVVNLRVFAGPKLRFDAGSTLSFQNVTGGNFDVNQLATDAKKAQLGLEAGAGLDVLMFTLDARVNLIGNMYETKLSNSTIASLPGSAFVISLGWKLF